MYRQLLGARWDRVPPAVRAAHAPGRVSGQLEVRRSPGLLTKLLAWLARVPTPGRAVPVRLQISRHGAELRWSRRLGAQHLHSAQWVEGDLLFERYGWVTFAFTLEAIEAGIRYVQSACWLGRGRFRVRLPARWAPRVRGSLVADLDGKAYVSIAIEAPLAGTLCVYEGHVSTDEGDAA